MPPIHSTQSTGKYFYAISESHAHLPSRHFIIVGEKIRSTEEIIIIIIIIIKTLLTLGLERKIYKNEIITAKDKRVIQASRSRTSHLQAILWETSNPKNANAPNRKRRKLTYLLLWI